MTPAYPYTFEMQRTGRRLFVRGRLNIYFSSNKRRAVWWADWSYLLCRDSPANIYLVEEILDCVEFT